MFLYDFIGLKKNTGVFFLLETCVADPDHFGKVSWIRTLIRIKVESWIRIRIRIKVKSRIRIRIQ